MKNELIIKDEIKNFLIEKFKLDRTADEISDEEPIFGSGISLNSIQGIELIVNLEIMYDIEFEDQDLLLNIFPNIGVLSKYVYNKLLENEDD